MANRRNYRRGKKSRNRKRTEGPHVDSLPYSGIKAFTHRSERRVKDGKLPGAGVHREFGRPKLVGRPEPDDVNEDRDLGFEPERDFSPESYRRRLIDEKCYADPDYYLGFDDFDD